MNIEIRQIEKSERREAENVIREAFYDLMGSGCDEHYLAHIMRNSLIFVPQLELGAFENGKMVGVIMFTKAGLKRAYSRFDGTVLTFGPLAVLPSCKGKGIGAALVKEGAKRAREMGFGGIIIYGHPDYYPRLGFRPASDFNITGKGGAVRDSLMAMELTEMTFSKGGEYTEDELFDIDTDRAEEFDRQFPKKEHVPLPSAEVLRDFLPDEKVKYVKQHAAYLAETMRFSAREIKGWGLDENDLDCLDSALQKYGLPKKLR